MEVVSVFRFRLEIAGAVAMDRGIARFADGISDYRPIWPVIEDDFYAQEKDQFRSEGVEGGEKWEPLSAAYAGWKEAAFPGKPILQRTGDLYESLTNPNSVNGVRREERKTLTLGSTLPYAIFHQRGTANMPPRPEVVFPEAFKRTVMHHVQTYLVQIASQSGFRSGGWSPLDLSRSMGSAARGRVPGASGAQGPRGSGRSRDSSGRFAKK
jgi:phage gpG-like protein